MGRPKKFVEPTDSVESLPDIANAPLSPSYDAEDDVLTQAQVLAIVEPHARLGVQVEFPTKTTWKMTMPFDNLRWYDRMQDRNLEKNVQHEGTEWSVSGNMRNTEEDIVRGLEYLAMLKKNYRPFVEPKK